MNRLLIIVILFSFSVFPQTKYLIYFKDKGITKQNVLSKSATLYKEALSNLSARSIERRKKMMGDNFITYEDFPLNGDYIQQLENMGVQISNKLRWFNAVSAYLTDAQFAKVTSMSFVQGVSKVKTLKLNPDMEKLYKNVNSLQSLDSLYGNSFIEYNLSDVPTAFLKGINGNGVIIGILDDGFRWKQHQAVDTRKVIAEYNFVFHDTSTAPQPGDASESGIHGTSVFSLIGGYEPGKIIGPAYEASFILAKTEDDRSETHVEEDNYAAALQWMESLGVDITTSSLGYNIFDDSTYSYTYSDMNGNTTIVTKAVNLAFERGVLCFTAAGNEGDNSWKYVDAPADAFNVIAVGAVDPSNTLASFSSIGPTADGRIKPDVVAMGEDNFVADISLGPNGFSYGSGTSYATPIASGIGAMLLSVYPEISNVQARNIILMSSENSQNPNNQIGYGLISAKNVLSFPVIDSTANGYQVNKIFFSNDGVIPNSVQIHYAGTSQDTSYAMNYDGKMKYNTMLDNLNNTNPILFYFTYTDSSGTAFTDPGDSYVYSINYGSVLIKLDVATSINPPKAVPANFVLSQNYPNPFNPSTIINYELPVNSYVTLEVFNVLGKKIRTLVSKEEIAGDYKVEFSASSLASGIYFYRISAHNPKNGTDFISTRKMILIK
jgi:serine protease AprX